MLRQLLLLVSIVLMFWALILLRDGDPTGVPMMFWGALLCMAVLVERWRYRPRHHQGEAEWVKTEERFIDPETGQSMRVHYNPRTGDRRYEQDDSGP